MINAFHSTLEEIEVSDLVLLIVDVSDEFEFFCKKINTSFNELIDIGVESPILIILNKIDLISNNDLKFKISYLKKFSLTKDRNIIPISAKNKININKLLSEIYTSLPNIIKFNIKLKNNKKSQSLINWIYSKAYVSKISYDNNINLTIECNELIKDLILSRIKNFND